MKMLVDAVLDYLEDNSIGTKQGDLFGLTLPVSPYACTCVLQSGGIYSVDDPTRHPLIQILHRNPNPEQGMIKTKAIFDLLSDKWNVLPNIPGRLSPVNELGLYFTDDNNHMIFSLNFILDTTNNF